MGEWAQLANTTGVAVAVLAAVGFALWRLGKVITHKIFGNPDINPPVPGVIDTYLGQQKDFFDTLKVHSTIQQELCAKHANALDTISVVLTTHDGFAMHRTEAIDSLVLQHTDPTIGGSTAEAIVTVEQMRQAALATCVMCRDLDHGDDQNKVQVHCDAIEKILMKKAN